MYFLEYNKIIDKVISLLVQDIPKYRYKLGYLDIWIVLAHNFPHHKINHKMHYLFLFCLLPISVAANSNIQLAPEQPPFNLSNYGKANCVGLL